MGLARGAALVAAASYSNASPPNVIPLVGAGSDDRARIPSPQRLDPLNVSASIAGKRTRFIVEEARYQIVSRSARNNYR